jgi:hypothetical protein
MSSNELNKRIHNPRPGEYIILYIHRHWIVLLWAVLKFLALATMPIILLILYSIQATIDWAGLGGLIFILSSSIYYLFIWLLLFNNLLDHFLDIWIITNERIINIEQKNLFSRIVAEKQLDKMQDITVITHGFLPTMFNYGNVFIQTAGSVERFIFKQISHPKKVANKIMEAVDRYRIKHGYSSTETNKTQEENKTDSENTK